MDAWYQMWRRCALVYHDLFTQGVFARGQEHIPRGPKIIVTNHPLASDFFLWPHVFTDRLSYMIDRDLVRFPIIGGFHVAAGHIPVGYGSSRNVLNLARTRLAEGYSIVAAIEGRLSPDRGFARPRVGAVLVAMETHVPITPVGVYVPPRFCRIVRCRLYGRERVGGLQVGGPCSVQIGPAWYPPNANEEFRSWSALHQLAQDLMRRVMDLVGQARVHTSASATDGRKIEVRA